MKKTTLAVLISSLLFGCVDPNRIVSDGERIGVIRKFSLKETGYSPGRQAPRSWEGEMDVSLPGSAGEVWLFSVPPDDAPAIDKVKAAMRSRKVVIAHYRQWLRVPTEVRDAGSGCAGPQQLQMTPYAVYDVKNRDEE